MNIHVNFEKYQKRKLTSIPVFIHSQSTLDFSEEIGKQI